MTESTWAKTRHRHLAVIQRTGEEPLPKALWLTENSKTDRSVDVPPHATCQPTAVCMGARDRASAPCYALSGFQTYDKSVRRQAQNQRLLESLLLAPYADVCRVADALWAALPRGADWLRWNGAGDLTPGACRLINAFTRRHGDVMLWVISRKPDAIRLLRDRASLRLLFSLDVSTPPEIASRLRGLCARFTHARLAYTRVSDEDVPPPDVDVVFNKHGGGKFRAWAHPRVCPATLPDGVHAGACDQCRRCFRECQPR